MSILFSTSKKKEVPLLFGVDWIVLTANAVGIAIVVLASAQNPGPTDTARQSAAAQITTAGMF